MFLQYISKLNLIWKLLFSTQRQLLKRFYAIPLKFSFKLLLKTSSSLARTPPLCSTSTLAAGKWRFFFCAHSWHLICTLAWQQWRPKFALINVSESSETHAYREKDLQQAQSRVKVTKAYFAFIMFCLFYTFTCHMWLAVTFCQIKSDCMLCE